MKLKKTKQKTDEEVCLCVCGVRVSFHLAFSHSVSKVHIYVLEWL